MITIRGQILVSRTNDDLLRPVCGFKNASVCTFKTSPCVPAPRAHVSPDESAQNVSKKKTFRTNCYSIFLRRFRIRPFFFSNYLHDSNSVFRAGGINSEWVFRRTVQCNNENFVPVVVLGLSTTLSSSSTSTSTTPSRQEIDHSDHHPAIESSESVDRQAREDPFTSETSEELFHEPTKSQNQIKMRITNRYEETRIQTYQKGCQNSERILWMKVFVNTETHTPVLLVFIVTSLN